MYGFELSITMSDCFKNIKDLILVSKHNILYAQINIYKSNYNIDSNITYLIEYIRNSLWIWIIIHNTLVVAYWV